jgi:hypothetical protein
VRSKLHVSLEPLNGRRQEKYLERISMSMFFDLFKIQNHDLIDGCGTQESEGVVQTPSWYGGERGHRWTNSGRIAIGKFGWTAVDGRNWAVRILFWRSLWR